MPTTMACGLGAPLCALALGLSGLSSNIAHADPDPNEQPQVHPEKQQTEVSSSTQTEGHSEHAHTHEHGGNQMDGQAQPEIAAQAADYRALGVHVHGVGELNVAVDGDALLVELISPAMDLLGFEHAPRTESQHKAVAQARAQLEQADRLFVPSAAADCILKSAEIALDIGTATSEQQTVAQHDQDHAHDHDHDHADDHSQESHADVSASYVFECRQPSKLNALSIGYFQAFPRAQKLQVQLLSETRQESLDLTPADQRLAF